MRHAFVSIIADDPSLPNDVRPQTNWNDTHLFGVTQASASLALVSSGASAHDLVEMTTGASNQTVTFPTAVGALGRCFIILKKDSGAGSVILATSLSQILKTPWGNLSSYPLVQIGQHIGFYSDNANWQMFTKSFAKYVNITPTGTYDGVNAVFTLPAAPFPASMLTAYRNGVRQDSTDFILSGNQITYVVPPAITPITDKMRVDFYF